jgi:hypothetical protein
LAFNANNNIIQMACASIASTISKVLAMPNIYVSPRSILPCFYNSKVSPISLPSPTKHGSWSKNMISSMTFKPWKL